VKPVTVLYLLLLFCCPLSSFGQGENNVWCYANHSAMDFNLGYPVFINSSVNAGNGVAMTDGGGNLIFYADAGTVFDRNGNVMPNGSGMAGYAGSLQGVAIVRSFNNPNQYYLFTNKDAYDVNGPWGVFYSVIDMTLNGGYGDVMVNQKNILLDIKMFQKMLVMRGNGCFVWLLLHERDDHIFHAFKIDATGIATTPVISNSGFVNYPNAYPWGEMCKSPNDSNIVLVNTSLHSMVEVHSFDRNNGIVNNAIELDSNIGQVISFSPDGSKLYVDATNVFYELCQYDFSLMPNVPAVINSKQVIDSNCCHRYKGLRVGPDDKMYVINDSNIYVINYPNMPGIACNFNPVPIRTSVIWGGFGNEYVIPDTLHFFSHDTTMCLADTPNLSAPGGYISYLWSDGSTTQMDTVTTSTIKWVISRSDCDIRTDTFHVFQTVIIDTSVIKDTTVCLVDNVLSLSGPPGYATYIWSDGIITQTDTVSNAGVKWVVSMNGSCDKRTDTFHVHAMSIATMSLIKDTNICFVNNIPILSAPPGYDTYLWSDGKTTQQDSMSQPDTKWVQAQTGCTMLVDTFHVQDWRDTTKLAMDTSHCVAYSPIPVTAPGGYTSYTWSDGHIGQTDTFFSSTTKWVTALDGCNMLIDTIHFTAIIPDTVSMYGIDTIICFDGVSFVNIYAPPGYTFYLWNDGITAQTNSFSGPGIKWVYAQKLCYLLIDTFSVSALPTDTTTSVTDTMICFSNAISLDATAGYDTYLWSDGISTQSDTFSQSGIKSVNAHKACAERIDTFKVQFINDLSVDLGPDSSICKGETLQLDATSGNYPEAQYLWQDGKTTAVYNVTEDGDYSVSVNVGPCTVSDTVKVHQKVINIDLGKGLIPCHGESVTLDAGVDSAIYLWQDGSTGRTYTATKAGSYSVTVTQGNCSATASVMVKYEGCPCHVLIPTAFSPNNDSRNDQFGVKLNCDIQNFKLMIYNRWGNQVFYSEDVNEKWDGTSNGIMLDGDVFNYYAEFKDGEGKMYYYKGTVTLVR